MKLQKIIEIEKEINHLLETNETQRADVKKIIDEQARVIEEATEAMTTAEEASDMHALQKAFNEKQSAEQLKKLFEEKQINLKKEPIISKEKKQEYYNRLTSEINKQEANIKKDLLKHIDQAIEIAKEYREAIDHANELKNLLHYTICREELPDPKTIGSYNISFIGTTLEENSGINGLRQGGSND